MPEGPEVRRIVERLDRFYRGREVTEIDFYDPTYRQKQVRDDVDEFVASLPATVESVKCKGKFIYWTFTNGFVMFHTLGMSGTWRIQQKTQNMVVCVSFGMMVKDVTTKIIEDLELSRYSTLKRLRVN